MRVNISAFKYAVVSVGRAQKIIALTSHLHYARRSLGCNRILETKEIEAFKVNAFVGTTFAQDGYIGYDAVDTSTDLTTLYIS